MPPESGGIPGRVHFGEVPFAPMLSPGWSRPESQESRSLTDVGRLTSKLGCTMSVTAKFNVVYAREAYRLTQQLLPPSIYLDKTAT